MSAARQPTAPLIERARRILSPTIFLPGLPSVDPVECLTWEALRDRLRLIAAGRRLVFTPGRAAYPDFDNFRAITVRAGADYLCTVAGRWDNDDELVRAVADLRGLA